MKQSDAKDFLPLIQAWAEGKTLQVKCRISDKWIDLESCASFLYSPSDYRIKPEPRTFYAVEYKDGSVAYVHDTKEKRDAFNSNGRGKPITLREVLDD